MLLRIIKLCACLFILSQVIFDRSVLPGTAKSLLEKLRKTNDMIEAQRQHDGTPTNESGFMLFVAIISFC
jgi:hypothetical protein